MNKRLHILLILLAFYTESCDKDEVYKNLPFDKCIYAIATQENIVWVGTFDNGLYKYDGESWAVYTESEGLASNTVNALVVDHNGVLWVGTNGGLSKLENMQFSNFKEVDYYLNEIFSLSVDTQNNLWIGAAKNILRKYDGTSFTDYHVNPELAGTNGHIHALASDQNGNIWVGSCRTGLSRFDGANWTHRVNNISIFVHASYCDENGGIWIGDLYGTHYFFNNVWTNYTTADGLVDNSVMCFCVDLQNNIWIGTRNGLSKYNGSSWKSYTTENGLIDNEISAIACDQQGNIWVGGRIGLTKLITTR